MKSAISLFAFLFFSTAAMPEDFIAFKCKPDPGRNGFAVDYFQLTLSRTEPLANLSMGFQDGSAVLLHLSYEGGDAHYEFAPLTPEDGDKYVSLFRMRGAWSASLKGPNPAVDTHLNCRLVNAH